MQGFCEMSTPLCDQKPRVGNHLLAYVRKVFGLIRLHGLLALIGSNIVFFVMYVRFLPCFCSTTCRYSGVQNGAFVYVRKAFAQFSLRNFLTYCIENLDFAFVRKAFAYFISGDFFTSRYVNAVFCLCT